MHIKTDQNGFTLLEVIVVLMISGLIAVILFQGLSLVLDARLRVASSIDDLDSRELQSSIVTYSMKGLLPDYPDGPDVFYGDQRRMRGLTLYPLQGTPGAPTAFGLSMEYDSVDDDTVLTYFERGYEPLELARWDGDIGAFSYKGRVGDWSQRWPIPGDNIVQTPRTIQMTSGLQDTSYIVRVMGPHDRVGRIQDGPFGAVQ